MLTNVRFVRYVKTQDYLKVITEAGINIAYGSKLTKRLILAGNALKDLVK